VRPRQPRSATDGPIAWLELCTLTDFLTKHPWLPLKLGKRVAGNNLCSRSREDLKPDLGTAAWRKLPPFGRMTGKCISPKSGSGLCDAHLGENSRETSFDALENRILQSEWRRGWDSNPRYGSPYARFRGEYFQPLSHLSAVVANSILADLCLPWLWLCAGGIAARLARILKTETNRGFSANLPARGEKGL
jgi:hypothetical protein